MSTIRFVWQNAEYSVYERPDGEEVFVAHGFPRVYLVEFDKDWMQAQWKAIANKTNFLNWMRAHLLDPHAVDDVLFCENCGDPTHKDDGSTVIGGGFACQFCIEEDYRSCEDCGEHSKDTTYTLHDESVCERCLRNNYTFCDDCDGYRHDSDYDHHHDDDDEDRCACESPAFTFSIRNDSYGMLANDHKVTVSLPAGTLDSESLGRIERFLRGEQLYDAARLVSDMDRRWQTKQGNFTKRLSRALYQKYKGKLTPDILSRVGSIARDHSKLVDFVVATTRDLNMSASDFYHDDSCWWQSYSAGRCALKSNGGFGLRSFQADNDPIVTGRAWVMPLVSKDGDLQPTFNTETPDAFVVFNCYGDLEGYAATRIISHMAGMTYRKVSFTCSPMFVNGDSACLVAPEEIAEKFTDATLRLSVDQHSNLFNIENTAKEELVNV